MQFGFMPGKGTTDAIFVVCQVQERFMDKKRPLFFAFVDLEKAFDRVPRVVLEWSLRELIVDDWLIKLIMSMYKNARSLVRVNGKLGEEFDAKVGVHQGSVLSPILLAIVLEVLSRGFSAGLPWELLYADDLVSVKLERWKAELSAKGLKVNTKKTKFMISKPVFTYLLPEEERLLLPTMCETSATVWKRNMASKRRRSGKAALH